MFYNARLSCIYGRELCSAGVPPAVGRASRPPSVCRDSLPKRKEDEETMGISCRAGKKQLLTAILLLAGVQLLWAQTAPVPQSFDVAIVNGHIIDGTGSPWYSGDVGIRAGKIAAIGNLGDAQRNRTIDAHGMVVAPGFVDMLGQSELT